MEKFVIEGGERLKGKIAVGGAKNAVLPVLAATLLQKGIYEIGNVPRLKDVTTMISVLGVLGAKSEWIDEHRLRIDTTDAEGFEAPYDLVKEMRASVLVLGALAGGRKRAIVSYPGGCAIGERPINLHLKGLSLLGCEVGMHEGYVDVDARNLCGATVRFDKPTVGGTENVLMAAVLAEGETVIENAAMEPEVVDLGMMLQAMGARIEGLGTPKIFVRGVESLTPCNYDVIPDRIEAGTFLVASGLTRGSVTIEGAKVAHLTTVIEKLREAGMDIAEENGSLRAGMSRKRPTAFDIRTSPYPGFPTDMQAQVMTMMSIAKGVSVVTESIFENRMMHAAELRRLGADVMVVGNRAVVRGVKALQGARVMATDLRASASLILAGLCAYGTTEVSRIYHIDRGYESIEKKLRQLGAKIERKKDEGVAP
ncbi:MAG TPA: UDP-N-acetylglucosamine 1-carboxyvinyltransferase [Syntrophorhabdales bacterium]|nr:UDP-N-acetylglucosamine 1-carboxyvinyltransferase [Syntrophorhabdales bacterium]